MDFVRAGLLAIAIVVAGGCGTELGPASPASDGGASTSKDAGADAAKEEPKLLEQIKCGSIFCGTGQACCLGAAGASCSGIGASCPIAADAGADAAPPPPLLCTTYNNCPGDHDDCCFTPDAGSQCTEEKTCQASRLCTIGQDGCGEKSDCEAFAESPDPSAIGRCVTTGKD